jgi:hypothetical protein
MNTSARLSSRSETFHEQNPDITVQFIGIIAGIPQDEEWSENTYLRNLARAATRS